MSQKCVQDVVYRALICVMYVLLWQVVRVCPAIARKQYHSFHWKGRIAISRNNQAQFETCWWKNWCRSCPLCWITSAAEGTAYNTQYMGSHTASVRGIPGYRRSHIQHRHTAFSIWHYCGRSWTRTQERRCVQMFPILSMVGVPVRGLQIATCLGDCHPVEHLVDNVQDNCRIGFMFVHPHACLNHQPSCLVFAANTNNTRRVLVHGNAASPPVTAEELTGAEHKTYVIPWQ